MDHGHGSTSSAVEKRDGRLGPPGGDRKHVRPSPSKAKHGSNFAKDVDAPAQTVESLANDIIGCSRAGDLCEGSRLRQSDFGSATFIALATNDVVLEPLRAQGYHDLGDRFSFESAADAPMATSKTFESKIKALDWTGLQILWDSVKRGDTPGWEVGKAFEYLVLRAFELEHSEQAPVEVRYPYEVTLFDEKVEEIDGAVHLAGMSFLVESKDWKDNVPIGPIAKMRNQLLRRPAGTVGMLFSRRGFTSSAVALAHFSLPQAILLWTGPELDVALSERAMVGYLRLKYRVCVEDGIPDYDLQEVSIP